MELFEQVAEEFNRKSPDDLAYSLMVHIGNKLLVETAIEFFVDNYIPYKMVDGYIVKYGGKKFICRTALEKVLIRHMNVIGKQPSEIEKTLKMFRLDKQKITAIRSSSSVAYLVCNRFSGTDAYPAVTSIVRTISGMCTLYGIPKYTLKVSCVDFTKSLACVHVYGKNAKIHENIKYGVKLLSDESEIPEISASLENTQILYIVYDKDPLVCKFYHNSKNITLMDFINTIPTFKNEKN